MATVSFGASGAWMGPISDKSRSVAHDALPYPDRNRDQSMSQRDDNNYCERVVPIAEENDKSGWEDTSSAAQERLAHKQDLNSHRKNLKP